MPARRVLVCFDYEGRWGMPYRAPYDIEAGTQAILDCLDRHRARAVFFTVGALAVEMGSLIAAIHARGHEIGLHGWCHEDLTRLSARERKLFTAGLAESEAAVQAVTGSPPTGYRAPYLLAPSFFDQDLHVWLAGRGYRYTSNREIRHVVELARPDRLRTHRLLHLLRERPRALDGRLSRMAFLGLNARVLGSDHPAGSAVASIRWLMNDFPPFFRDGLLEIPVYTPLDCDLIGFPDPRAKTPPDMLEYAQFALRATTDRGGPITMLTFHDWIIVGGNRIGLLDRLLSSLGERSIRPVTVQECWPELTALAGSDPVPAPSASRHTRR